MRIIFRIACHIFELLCYVKCIIKINIEITYVAHNYFPLSSADLQGGNMVMSSEVLLAFKEVSWVLTENVWNENFSLYYFPGTWHPKLNAFFIALPESVFLIDKSHINTSNGLETFVSLSYINFEWHLLC